MNAESFSEVRKRWQKQMLEEAYRQKCGEVVTPSKKERVKNKVNPPDYANNTNPDKWRFYFYGDLIALARNILNQLQDPIDSVVAIARSGLAPGSFLAHSLQVPLFSYSQSDKLLTPLGGGWRAKTLRTTLGRTLVIDDSVYSGYAIQACKDKIASEADSVLTSACIVRPMNRHKVDLVGTLQESPHLFEWHLPNSGAMDGRMANPALKGGAMLDFDGVLCPDCPPGCDGNDTPEQDAKYERWLRSAPPLLRPTLNEVEAVVSFRLEKYRKITTEWLDKWSIRVKNLFLYPINSFRHRNANFNVIEHKGVRFKESTCSIMVESCARQAKIIAEFSRKPVICYDTGEVYYDP